MHRPLLLAAVAALAHPMQARAQAATLELALRHLTAVDETLSPLRYAGPAVAARAGGAMTLRGLRIAADADVAHATLGTDAGPGGRPALRFTSATLALRVERRSEVAGLVLLPGLWIAARAAELEHEFTTAQSGGRYSSLTQSSSNELVAVGPSIRVERALASGRAIDVSLAASVFGLARHDYAAGGGDDAPWRSGGPGDLLLVEGAAGWRRPVGRRGTLGARYSLRLLRLGGASRAAEVSHQLGLTLGWGRR